MIVLIVLLIILIGIVAYLSYFVLVNFYSAPVSLQPEYTGSSINFSQSPIEQFYPNMRFKNSSISYYFTNACPDKRKEEMVLAFRYLENATGDMSFYEQNGGEIEISCGDNYPADSGGFFVAGEGGPKSVINGSLFNVILNGQIFLLSSDTCSYNVELHELFHVLGYMNHSQNPKDIMYNVTSCGQQVDPRMILKLRELYSFESLSDLYFDNVVAVKKGRYLNLNFTVRNQGLDTADNVSVDVLSGNSKIEEFDLGDINIGEGKIFSVENLGIPMNTESINLTARDGRELDLSNNLVNLVFGQ